MKLLVVTRVRAVIALAATLSGCAANSGVAPTGPDAYIVSRQAATGFSGSGNLKAEALTEANDYCAQRNKVMFVTQEKEVAPPYVMGNFPKAEISFMCVNGGDPRTLPPR